MTTCDSCQRTKPSNVKYAKLPAQLAEGIPWNKLCVGLIVPYVIPWKGKKENLYITAVTIIDPITGWF